MEEKAIGRADFFKYIFGKTASAASQLAENMLEPLQEAEKTANRMLFNPLIPVEEYNGEPKMLASSKPPVYILGELDKNLTAYPANCEKDGFLLTYLPQENALYCSICGAKHVITYEEERVVTDLAALPLTIKEGFISLIRN